MSRRLACLSIVLSVACGFVVTQGSGAVAGTPDHFIDHSVGIFCSAPPLTNTNGDIASVDVSSDQVFGAFADLAYWAAPASPDTDPPTYQFSTDTPPTIAATDSHIDVTFPLMDADGNPVTGSASLVADMTPNGDIIYPTESKGKNGNSHFRDDSTFQPLSVTGTLTIPGGVAFDLAGCSGEIDNIDVFTANPNTFVSSTTNAFVDCQIVTNDYALDLHAEAGFLIVFLDQPTRSIFGITEDPTFTSSALQASVPMSDTSTGEIIGDAVLSASLTPGERISFQDNTSTQHQKVIGTVLQVAGSLTLPTDPPTVIDMSACEGFDGRSQFIRNNPSGPKPGGKVPSNDAPSGAILVAPGTSLNLQTGGAAVDPEAPCTFGPFGDLPIVHTVWYKVVGTGSQVTFDSGGSSFDTILGVYTQGTGGLEQIGCVDDVPRPDFGRSLQAAITFDTTPGTTYYVQAGGFDDPRFPPFGRLRLHVS